MSAPVLKLTTNNTLMDLRLIILRTISLVWKDEHSDPPIDLRKKIEKMNPIQLSKFFAKEFKYHMPFENFGVQFIKATAEWNFYGNNEWTKPQGETITLSIPKVNTNWNEYTKTQKLLQYYTYFPNFFGAAQNEEKPVDPQKKSMAPGQSDSSGIDLSGNDYNLGVSEQPFLSFGAVMSKLIAVAWGNPKFMSKVDYNARLTAECLVSEEETPEKKDFDKKYFREMYEILSNYFEFDFPWAFNIKFVTPEDSESFWDRDGNWREKNDCGSRLIRNKVTLEIPQAPTINETTNVALALARYNAIGPAYPFTCS